MRWLAIAVIATAGCGAPPPTSSPPAIGNTVPPPPPGLSPRLEERLPADPQLDPTSPMIGEPMPVLPDACLNNTLRVETEDKNSDGQSDVWRVYQTYPDGKRVLRCKQDDFDFNGRLDLVRAYDHAANEMLELRDFAYTGWVTVALVPDPETGAVSILRDTDGDGLVDTVEN